MCVASGRHGVLSLLSNSPDGINSVLVPLDARLPLCFSRLGANVLCYHFTMFVQPGISCPPDGFKVIMAAHMPYTITDMRLFRCLQSAALKLHLDLPQRFLTNNFAADYQSDFQQGLHVTFTLSGQLCGPEVNLPVKKGVNRRNDQNGNISWKHKLCIGKDVRLSLPQLAWVGSIEATGPRHITVDLHTQPPQVQQQRQAQQRAQQLAGAVSKPIAGASATAHSARRQAAGKLQAAARHRVSITAVNRKTPQPNNLVLIEPAAKRQCTEARKAPTAAGFAAARSRLIASGQPAAMGKAPNAVASGNNSLSQHLPSAAAAAARSGAGAPGSALRHSSSSSNSSSGWHPMVSLHVSSCLL